VRRGRRIEGEEGSHLRNCVGASQTVEPRPAVYLQRFAELSAPVSLVREESYEGRSSLDVVGLPSVRFRIAARSSVLVSLALSSFPHAFAACERLPLHQLASRAPDGRARAWSLDVSCCGTLAPGPALSSPTAKTRTSTLLSSSTARASTCFAAPAFAMMR